MKISPCIHASVLMNPHNNKLNESKQIKPSRVLPFKYVLQGGLFFKKMLYMEVLFLTRFNVFQLCDLIIVSAGVFGPLFGSVELLRVGE